jgi:seryl-tRNA synthetase
MSSAESPTSSASGVALDPVGAALFQPLGVDGVYARTARYENVIEALSRYISVQRDAKAEVLRFPPVMSRWQLEKSGYLKSFPNLLGCICALHGSEREIRAAVEVQESGGDWTQALSAADLVLSPAACYPVYPLVARRGALPPDGLLFDVAADCFRHEPSRSISRLQSFRMREFVRIGTASQVVAFREQWVEQVEGLVRELGLPFTLELATDPFFGRVGQVMAVSQRQQALKLELLIPCEPATAPTACMSFNYHREHFGEVWNLRDGGGVVAHTACVAFGMDRLAVALFYTHGVDISAWPASVRRALAL